MPRVAFLIDGFNVYHAIDDIPAYHKYKWLDHSKLAKCFAEPNDQIVQVLLFTSYATWNPGKNQRHRILVSAQQSRGVKVVFGNFKFKSVSCRICGNRFKTPIEKRTDVNIASHLFMFACLDKFDKAVLVTGDNDLEPAIKAFKKAFPAKRVEVVLPMGRYAHRLKRAADFAQKMRKIHLETSQLDDVISLKSGRTLFRPKSWS